MTDLSAPDATWTEALQSLVRTYTRAFLSQGVGLVGLLWCLFDAHPEIGLLLATLVLTDQAMFLRSRAAAPPGWSRVYGGIDLWCILISLADVHLLGATLFQAAGLRAIGSNQVPGGAQDYFVFTLATFVHAGTDLAPATAGGRLLAVIVALLGAATFAWAGAYLLAWFLARRRAEP